ncbi:hypothetical protein JJB11_11150 [Ramlibacter ginsenosidimutans]|uniref:Uncharacterized protein n=1 Tax=Ramlibacter ginsenosidimutans TaxID=502333 RepID=A0A934WLD3_9BURK|nr:hypothetical protein [Ramlibacter ginsenosidimutans]MBK6006649.1 hypothetical protein [Ramlibacter ginsenosidimutans]
MPYGREQSFKLVPGALLADRMLIGVPTSTFSLDATVAVGAALGMPTAAQQIVTQRFGEANAVFFATEESGVHRVFKLYLEFWDAVRRRVRAGDASPQLLHLGVKWDSARPGHFEEAHYICVPLLNTRDVLQRMRAVVPEAAPAAAVDIAQDIVRLAARVRPQAPFLYLEVSETGNPRRSFDVNLYKSGLAVADAASQLRAAAAHFAVAGERFEAVLAGMQQMPLGHIAAGCDRRGGEFFSVYAEVAPLP